MGSVRMLLHALLLQALPLCSMAASILGFFPFPGNSHHHLFGPLMERLSADGHEVLYVTPISWKSNQSNHTELMVTNYGPKVLGTLDFIELGEMNIARHSHTVYNQIIYLMEHVLQEEGIQKLIHSKRSFDAVIMESYFFQEANSALIHKFGAVGIELVPLADSAWVNELSGLPNSYSFMMDYKTMLTDQMTLSDKIYNLYVGYAATLASYYNLRRMQELMDRYYNYTGWESRPPLTKLVSNRSIILINKDPLLAYPFPTSPHVKEIAGIHILPTKPLPKRLREFMDEAENGVIYMSLGLNLVVSDVLQDSFFTFLNVFSQLKQRVLMKWEADYDGSLPSNVMIMKKFPQQDILAHRNCILFITHGGYMSLVETVYHGIPLVGIPFYGDQPKNVIWSQEVGIGVHLSLKNLTEASIKWAVKEVIENKSYRERVQQRSRMVKDRRHSALDEAVFWVEHAIKYPNALTPASAYMTFLELHMLDLGLTVLVLLIVMVAILCFLCKAFAMLGGLSTNKKKLKAQ
ncbi:UDP-glycosyltransferase UGT4 [Halyomorpha halys]|uniref:UDP-glycosyltransferase UGT4 n=1 Tax=Halyomorpha halys TaxID=286706 RepID=UPI0006D4EEFE|nr:UDP-glucuronosyltransferase 2B7-like [Halyomorpha halys]XP_014275847.1 UDP-glucuronosyltransferase 2B7-like [Halyomorpha halys]XP_014275848.1 UDP-glucuronosyltransferase 2B7-like [Halyomorpha halys]XP_014275849.1 UDP-glucuronosyltransferase 2B7-like [Halyomorpha halys]